MKMILLIKRNNQLQGLTPVLFGKKLIYFKNTFIFVSTYMHNNMTCTRVKTTSCLL